MKHLQKSVKAISCKPKWGDVEYSQFLVTSDKTTSFPRIWCTILSLHPLVPIPAIFLAPIILLPSFSLNHISYSSAFLNSSSFLFGTEYFFCSAWKLHSFLLTYWFRSCQHQYHLCVWGTPRDRKKPKYIPSSSISSYGVRPNASSMPQVPWAEFGKNYKCPHCLHRCREVPRNTYWPPPLLQPKSMAGAAISSRLEACQLWTRAWQIEDPASVLHQSASWTLL